MKKSLLLPLIVAVAVIIVFLLGTSIKRVPAGRQGLLIHEDGSIKSFGPGTHLVPPLSDEFVTYPVGELELRFPAEGTFDALTKDGVETVVAVSLRSEFLGESAPYVYRTLGKHFRSALEEKIRDVIELQTARFSVPAGTAMPEDYEAAVVDEIKQIFIESRIVLAAYRFDAWEVGAVGRVAVGPEPVRRVILLGVDGADWKIIRDLIARGRLPNFRKLVEEGTTGPLRSIEPLLSPLLWTTIATGKLPEEHGILNFTVVDPSTGKKVPISRLYRKVDALWNQLSDYGRTVDIVGWLATFPAEPINGVMVTDRLGYLAYAEADDDPSEIRGIVSPEERLDEIKGLVTQSADVPYEELRRFVHVDREAFLGNRDLPFDPKNPVNNMIMLYASTRTFADIADHLADDRPDFLAAYFELVDATKHLFMHYAEPRQPEIDETGFEMFKDAVNEAYAVQDSIIGEFIGRCDSSTVLIVASDHGFKSGDSRPKLQPEIWAGKAAYWHLIDGIICIYGNGIRRGARIEGASILDIAPTVLALQGLPRPRDMPGSVLEDAFDRSLVSGLNRTTVATLQRERELDELALDTGDAATDEALKKLEALGYITPDNPDAHNNLGQRYQEQGNYSEAIEEFKKALAIRPDFPGALNNLGVCYGKLRQHDKAEEVLKKAITLNPQDVYAMNNLAIMYMELKQLDEARSYSEKSVAIEPNYANGHLTLGSIYATMGELSLAEEQFLKALEIDPSNQGARSNLQRVRSQLKAN
jgi:tetratricopeptide (TPR) repeat protein